MTDVSVPQLLLASGSPRRKELLAQLGIPFSIVVSGFDEGGISTDGLTPAAWTMRLAEGKARAAVLPTSGQHIVLGADTTVTLDGQYFNKPTDEQDAARMLGRLAGRTHEVTTGVCVLDTQTGMAQTAADTARVTFAPMTAAEIVAYIATGDPLDKAGAYGVQGGLLPFVPRVNGDFYTVMGLPVALVRSLLLPFFPNRISSQYNNLSQKS